MPPPKKPFERRLDEIAEAVQSEEHWTRPTDARRQRIERSVGPVSYPPQSTSPGKRWTPASLVLVFGAFGAMCVTVGGALGPLLVKPDLSGYVKREELTACGQRLDEREKASEKAIDRERGRTSACYDKLGACQSQSGAQEQVIESLEQKPKRRR